jgi:BioD-like phosphotransacetylase family protein
LVALYIVSSGEAAGKTTIGAGVGKRLLSDGRKVGFLRIAGGGDAAFMKEVLGMAEPADSLCPAPGKVEEAYVKVARGKDVVIVEGTDGPGEVTDKAAKVIIVESYDGRVPVQLFLETAKASGEGLLGVVLNKVPKSQLKGVTDELMEGLKAAGIMVLGVLPEDRALLSLTVGELADSVGGKILNNAERSVELVENLMVGAMSVDSGLDYFGRKTNKAVVVRDDRPDMQMAALETPVKCLVVSGEAAPIDYVRYKAEDKGVPIVTTKSDTSAIVESIEEALGKARLNQEKKLTKVAEIVGQHLDFPAIYKGLGLG